MCRRPMRGERGEICREPPTSSRRRSPFASSFLLCLASIGCTANEPASAVQSVVEIVPFDLPVTAHLEPIRCDELQWDPEQSNPHTMVERCRIGTLWIVRSNPYGFGEAWPDLPGGVGCGAEMGAPYGGSTLRVHRDDAARTYSFVCDHSAQRAFARDNPGVPLDEDFRFAVRVR